MINLIEWKDRIIQFPKRFYVKNNSDGTATLEEAPGTVAEPGTPVSASNMNALRTGIFEAAPVSAVMFFARSDPPGGWLLCNGSAISRSTYWELFNAIGTTYGAGNGSTTFNLPDLRGEFIRGWDRGRGVDPGRAMGSWQDYQAGFASDRRVHYGLTDSTAPAYPIVETRPRNVALLPCIKF